MDKRHLIAQMATQLRETARIAQIASEDAEVEARVGASPNEKRQDARVALEYSQLAGAQSRRAQEAASDLRLLNGFRPGPLTGHDAVEVGAIVEVEDDETGEGRTFFLAPIGAGMNLTGPGGDGLLTVVTPASPIGKAVVGRCVGDVVDLTVQRRLREWAITYVC